MLISTIAVLITGDDDIFINADCSGLICETDSPLPSFAEIGIDALNLQEGEYQAVMNYRGISFAQSRAEGVSLPLIGDPEVLNYGGWLEHHFFGVQAMIVPNTREPSEAVVLFSYAFGNETGSNPESGSGEWNGVAIGVDASKRFDERRLLTADVTVSIADFLNPTVDVLFDSIRDLRTGDPLTVSGLTVDSVGWEDLDLTDGSFGEELGSLEDPLNISNPRKRIEGQFYGPNHEEVGGIFEYATVGGSFGAKRDEQ